MKSFGRFLIGTAAAVWTVFALGEKAIQAIAPTRAPAVESPARAELIVPATYEIDEPAPWKASSAFDGAVTDVVGLAHSGPVQAVVAMLIAAIVSLVFGYKARPTIDRRREDRAVRAAQRRQLQREQDLRLLAQASSRGNAAGQSNSGSSSNPPGGKRPN